MMNRLVLLLVFAALTACGTWLSIDDANAPRPATHVVERGENLFRIAWRYGLDYRDIATWNELESPDLILAGQRLRLYPPGISRRDIQLASRSATASMPAANTPPSANGRTAPAVSHSQRDTRPSSGSGDWEWPTEGQVVSRFNPSQPGNKGIQIRATPNQTVHAASAGEIVYRGSGLRGYGRLLVVKHSSSTLSAYGHLGRIFVSEGDRVEKGQAIAELSETGPPSILHFEIRKNGNPVDPMPYLSG
jgi:lipoprotein NlpD